MTSRTREDLRISNRRLHDENSALRTELDQWKAEALACRRAYLHEKARADAAGAPIEHSFKGRLKPGLVLREMRELEGQSVEAAAVGAVIPVALWRAFEDGKVRPTITELHSIAFHFDADFDVLMDMFGYK